ncbi:MAG: phosphatidate cytidylyltransferase [Gammaproteobacteria bacterium]|nr:MAG: phosphatidate cytidylyltransferase [Gammaproteobacteria bacterium]
MLKQRIITALILVPLAIALILYSGDRSFSLAVALLFGIAGWEWGGISGRPGSVQRIFLALSITLVCLALWWFNQRDWLDDLLAAGVLFWTLVIVLLPGYRQTGMPTHRWRWLLLLAAFFVLLPAWAGYTLLHAIHPGWVIYVMMLCVTADTGAYFAGKRFGRRKLAPELSPGKTREGLLGGLAGVLLLATGTGLAVDMGIMGTVYLVLLSLVAALVSVTGDLFISLLKRESGVKDTGHLLPGHGGLLDRIDSHVAATPVFTLGLLWWLG